LKTQDATILAFCISRGETGDIHALDEHTLSRYVFSGPYKLAREQIETWFPKEKKEAA
jgi:hypothetical protein